MLSKMRGTATDSPGDTRVGLVGCLRPFRHWAKRYPFGGDAPAPECPPLRSEWEPSPGPGIISLTRQNRNATIFQNRLRDREIRCRSEVPGWDYQGGALKYRGGGARWPWGGVT